MLRSRIPGDDPATPKLAATHFLVYFKGGPEHARGEGKWAGVAATGAHPVTRGGTTAIELRRTSSGETRRCFRVETAGHSRTLYLAPEGDHADWVDALTTLTPPADPADHRRLRTMTLGGRPAVAPTATDTDTDTVTPTPTEVGAPPLPDLLLSILPSRPNTQTCRQTCIVVPAHCLCALSPPVVVGAAEGAWEGT